MNADTVTLITRPYQEIVDDALTAIVGGVVNEPIRYDVKTTRYPLARPAQDVRGITGIVDQEHYTFQKGIDFVFNPDDNTVAWEEDGTRPDDETVYYVDYFRQNSRSPLTDINVGSVTRTLSEAISREIATVYQQINIAYRSGFIDTAEGKSLDYVVAILGTTRKTGEFAEGLVTFFRDPQVQGDVTIREGVTLLAKKGEVRFETSELRTLQNGQTRIDVPVRAAEGFQGATGKVGAGEINELLQPIAGIARVTNFEPTILGGEDESDDQLRARAKAELRALGKGTLLALIRAILERRAIPIEVWDANSPGAQQSPPGTVTVLVESEPERMPDLYAAVQETRAAGVLATLVARYVFFKPRLQVAVQSGLSPAGKEKVLTEIIAALQAYVDTLGSGQPAEGKLLLEAAKSVKEVKEARIADVMSWRSDLGRPGAQTLVEAILLALAGSPADQAAQRAAIEVVLAEEAPTLVPTGGRIPDRDLVQGAGGGRATDEELEAGEFTVAATVDGENWWVVLDFEPADIVLQENGGS